MVNSAPRDISTEIRRVLEHYFKIHSLLLLKQAISTYEQVPPFSDVSWSIDTVENKGQAIKTCTEYFLKQNFPQKAFDFLRIIDELRKELNQGEYLHSEFVVCLVNLKREFFLAKIEALCQNRYNFHILVSRIPFKSKGVTEVAQLLLNYPLIRGQMLSILSLPIQFSVDRDKTFPDTDVDKWYGAVGEVFSILETCFKDSKDVEYLLFRIKEVFGISEDWTKFYEKICKYVNKNITATPLQELQTLIERANFPEETLREAYDYSLGNYLPSSTALEIASLLQNLAIPRRTKRSFPVVKFVAYLGYQAGKLRKLRVQEALKNWNEDVIQLFEENKGWLDDLLKEVQIEGERAVYLLIVVKSDDAQTLAKLEKKQMFTVSAWLLDDENDKIGSVYQSKEAVPFSNIPQYIDEIRTQFVDYLGRIKEVDLFFEKRLLFRTIDSWKIDTGLERVQFIKELTWVVRSLDRAEQYKKIKHKWIPLWDHFQEINGDIKEIFRAYKEDECRDREKLRDNISSHTDFCIALSFLPSASHHKPIFTTMLNEGVPIILWYERERKSMPDNFPAWLEELLVEKASRDITKIRELPTLIRDARRTRPKESKHLMLLWDNPYRLPPMSND